MIGIHLIGSVQPHLDLIRRWQPRVVLLLDPAIGAAAAVKAAAPRAFLVGRVYHPDPAVEQAILADPAAAGQWAASLVAPVAAGNPQVNVWQVANEVSQRSTIEIERLGRFSIAYVDALRVQGRRAAIGGFSVGRPDIPDWPAFYPAMRHARTRGGVLLLHAYGAPTIYKTDPNWYLHRYERQVLHRLPADLRDMPYLYGEFGADLGIVPTSGGLGWKTGYAGNYYQYATDLRNAAAYLARFSYCLGAALFTLGGVNDQWNDFRIDGVPAAYLASIPWPLPQLPPEEDMLVTRLRQQFGARFHDVRATLESDPAQQFDRLTSRTMSHIAVHHATGSRDTTPETIARAHVRELGLPAIGYHFVIRRGHLYYTGDVDTQRAHVAGRNHEALGVCLTGNYTTVAPASEDVTALRTLVAALDAHYGHAKRVVAHKDLVSPGSTTCPAHLAGFLPDLRRPRLTNYRELAWGLEEAARFIRDQRGLRTVHDAILASALYQDALRRRDAG